jgi:hypothetical protein
MKLPMNETPLARFGEVNMRGDVFCGNICRSISIVNDEFDVSFPVSEEEYLSWRDDNGIAYDKIIAFIEYNLKRMIKRPVSAIIVSHD